MIITPADTMISVASTPDEKNVSLIMTPLSTSLGVHLIMSPDNVRELIIELEKFESF